MRVQPLAEDAREPRLGEATLTATALGSGAVRTWQDSLVTLDDGARGLLFFAAFRPEVGETYRIEVEAEDGASERLDVAMPLEPTLTAARPAEVGGIISQRLLLASEIRPVEVRVLYTVRRTDGGEPVQMLAHYDAQPVAQGSGFDLLVRLSRDAATIRALLGVEPEETDAIALLDLRLRYAIEDPARAVVEGGLGAIGVAAAFETGWTLEPEFVEALGFVDAQGE